MNNEENGLIQTKLINGVKLTLKYLPQEYLVYNEVKDLPLRSKETLDSIRNQYSKCRTFLLTIATDGDVAKGDIMYLDVSSVEDYKSRVQELNFDIKSHISIKTQEGEFYPVLTTLENTYGLSNERNIYIVFSDNGDQKGLMSLKTLDLKFEDEVFQSGISHFVFDKDDLDKIPELKF